MYTNVCVCMYICIYILYIRTYIGWGLSEYVTVSGVDRSCSVLPASEVGIAHREVCLLQWEARSLEVRFSHGHGASTGLLLASRLEVLCPGCGI